MRRAKILRERKERRKEVKTDLLIIGVYCVFRNDGSTLASVRTDCIWRRRHSDDRYCKCEYCTDTGSNKFPETKISTRFTDVRFRAKEPCDWGTDKPILKCNYNSSGRLRINKTSSVSMNSSARYTGWWWSATDCICMITRCISLKFSEWWLGDRHMAQEYIDINT